MRNEEIFRTLWKNLQEEMIASINFQIDNRKTINYQELRKIYKDQLSRWNSRMASEGAWLLDVENERAKEEVLAAISALDLQQEASGMAKKQAPIITGGLCGAAVCISTIILRLSVPVNVLGFTGGFAAGCTLGNKHNNSSKMTQMDNIKNSYIRQIDRDGERLAAIWRKYDG